MNRLGNPLQKLSKVIDFEIFMSTLEEGLYVEKFTKIGAKPYDYVLMFKILIIKQLYGLSYEQTEYQIIDRLSFRSFLGLSSGDKIPDSNTIRNFSEQLTNKNLYDNLFNMFGKLLKDNGLIMNEGKIIDGSFVEVPHQRNTREENKQIKSGKGKELWQDEKDKNKRQQKDIEARWAKKNVENFFGYKSHAKIDSKSKFVTKVVVIDASVHESQVIEKLIDSDDYNEDFFADSAYIGKKVKKVIRKQKMKDKIIKRASCSKELSKNQISRNKKNASVRCRVEHIFGFCEPIYYYIRFAMTNSNSPSFTPIMAC